LIKVSNRTKYNAGIFGKIILATLVSLILIVAIILAAYKPVYSVSIDGEFKGYVSSRNKLEQDIEEYMQAGDSERVGYILLNQKPEYNFGLVKKDTPTKDEEILLAIKDTCDVYFRVFAINVNDEEACLASNLSDAQKIVDDINDAQSKYLKKATVVISEKYLKEYTPVENIELAVADIIAPLKTANDAAIKQKAVYDRTYDTKTTVSQEVLKALLASNAPQNFNYPLESYVITSRYGWRRSGFHTGIDYAAPTGTPIYACADGVVTCAAWTGNYGYLIKVQHGGGVETYYAHCSKFNCEVGDNVKQGDLIGYVGSTGNSTGPHVHLEIRYNGSTVDPYELVD